MNATVAMNGKQVPSEASNGKERPATPSANGPNGRDGRGRFAKGNAGGPGNPFARQMAVLRSALIQAVSEEDIHEIARTLITQARLGNLAAAKLVLAYVIGKPAMPVNPDNLDLEEWQTQQQWPMADALQETSARCPADMASAVGRSMAMVRKLELAQVLDGPGGRGQEAGGRRQEAEGKNQEAGDRGQESGWEWQEPPTANGDDGDGSSNQPQRGADRKRDRRRRT